MAVIVLELGEKWYGRLGTLQSNFHKEISLEINNKFLKVVHANEMFLSEKVTEASNLCNTNRNDYKNPLIYKEVKAMVAAWSFKPEVIFQPQFSDAPLEIYKKYPIVGETANDTYDECVSTDHIRLRVECFVKDRLNQVETIGSGLVGIFEGKEVRLPPSLGVWIYWKR
ncbi:hypothetical protein CONCODRAFT_3922 [Conidiobolus coronatus NRRL 28638]|uniref:Uncharacterized protein n=1 Tax=Conidiobolus coronatus (strain ATCC 28846 / CBS 209.66 / NRRL 28638) TaxID=796925 RepID=A0A137PE06_CONC2|nr:hypothetical protein CONCODRAFT_3922 [Conidiobolus coronatus NRRL 28638]|eukprot:KXN73244.1 hypothetical protein CONCODRAFT_3922 [Conidiobolus coronatus NRRL 28638]